MPLVGPRFRIGQFLKAKTSNNAPIPPKITRFRKVALKMLQHGASDMQAQMAAEPRPGKKVSGQPETSNMQPQASYAATAPISIIINLAR